MDCNSSKLASYIRYPISVTKKTAHISFFLMYLKIFFCPLPREIENPVVWEVELRALILMIQFYSVLSIRFPSCDTLEIHFSEPCSGHREVKCKVCSWPPDPTLRGRSSKPKCHFSPFVWLTAAVKWCSGLRSALRFEGPLAGVFQPEAHYSHFGVRCACYSMLAITGGAPSQVSDAVVSVVGSDLSPASSLGPGLP